VTNPIESAAAEEYRPGVSPGAAARQLIRTLGCSGHAPTLKRMLEDMLADANKASTDRSRILADVRREDPVLSRKVAAASFQRNNA